MHILHFIESLEFGGAEKVVVNLCNQAVDHGYRVSVVLTKRKGQLVEQLSKKVQLIFLDLGEGNHPRLPGMLADICRQQAVDVLHGHEWSVLIESILAARQVSGIRHVHTIHGHYIQYGSGWKAQIKKIIRRQAEKILARRIDSLVGVSEAISGAIRSDLKLSKNVFTIHNGIADLESSSQRVLDQADQQLRLLWVGRVAAVKNLPMLIEALSLVKQQGLLLGVNWRLELVGDGPQLTEIKQLAKARGLAEQIVFHGFCEQVTDFYRNADVFVMTSDYEGISIAALEAMRDCLPIVATQVGGMPEMVKSGGNGLLVPAGNAEAFANALAKIGNEADFRRQCAQQARQKFLREFEQSVMFEQYLACYRGR